jgi:hypothetical protein
MRAIKSWAIQSSGLRINDDLEQRLMDALKDTCTSHVMFGCIPFTNEITGWEDFPDEDMFVHCSTKVLKILTDYTIPSEEIFVGASPEQAYRIRQNLLAGVFYDVRKFDQAVYSKDSIREHLLNGDARVVKIKDWLYEEFPREYFVKPTKDLKSFKGGVIQAGYTLWQFVNEGMLDASFMPAVEAGETMLIAMTKEILREYRFFVVDGEVPACSQYMVGDQVKYESYVPLWLKDKAREFAQIYQPSRAFTIDLCVTKDLDVKIVEYNCINCSGLYHANIAELIRYLAYMR